jgi:hypothetical protein
MIMTCIDLPSSPLAAAPSRRSASRYWARNARCAARAEFHLALGTDSSDALPANEGGVTFFDFDSTGAVAGFWAG